jgi:DNA-binding winged helix-turn-helix (wHTH) protein
MAERLRFGEFVYEGPARRLTRAGRPVALAPRAFDLLSALLEARPRAVGKAELARQLWPGTWVSRTSLAQLVRQLRKATGDDTRHPRFIRTVFGRGYAWIGQIEERQEEGVDPARIAFWIRRGEIDVPLSAGVSVLGRSPDATIRLRSLQASRRQARIVVTAGGAVLEDLGSRNGTSLNGHRLDHPARLNDGDQIVIGDEVLVFCAAEVGTTREADGGTGGDRL